MSGWGLYLGKMNRFSLEPSVPFRSHSGSCVPPLPGRSHHWRVDEPGGVPENSLSCLSSVRCCQDPKPIARGGPLGQARPGDRTRRRGGQGRGDRPGDCSPDLEPVPCGPARVRGPPLPWSGGLGVPSGEGFPQFRRVCRRACRATRM